MQISMQKMVASQNSSEFRGDSSEVKVGKHGQKKSMSNRPIPGLNIPSYDNDHKSKCIDEKGSRVCYHFRRKGHTVRTCFRLAKEQGSPIPGRKSC